MCWLAQNHVPRPTDRKRPSIRLKMQPLPADEEEPTLEQPKPIDMPFSKQTDEYPLSYHSLEFLPYSPLPDQLEKVIFPYRTSPLADHDDPYWPTKVACLDLVQEVRANPQLANFPGTFLPPAARGAE